MCWAHAIVYGRNKVQHKLQTKQPERRLMASSSIFSILSSLSLALFLSISHSLAFKAHLHPFSPSFSVYFSSFKQEAGPLRSFAIFCLSLDNLTANYRSIFCCWVKCLSMVISLKLFLYCKQSPPVFVCVSVRAWFIVISRASFGSYSPRLITTHDYERAHLMALFTSLSALCFVHLV